MRKIIAATPVVALLLVLSVTAYVGIYFALVVPGGIPEKAVLNFEAYGVSPPMRQVTVSSDKFYRFGSKTRIISVFWPLECLDRRIRPEAWVPIIDTLDIIPGTPVHDLPTKAKSD